MYSLQQIFEANIQNPKNGTFTKPCASCVHTQTLDASTGHAMPQQLQGVVPGRQVHAAVETLDGKGTCNMSISKHLNNACNMYMF